MLNKGLLIAIFIVLLALLFVAAEKTNFAFSTNNTIKTEKPITNEAQYTVTPTITPYLLQIPPLSKTIPNSYHITQTFNNCGPASLSMALSYYGIQKTQQELGNALRPYQHPTGDNDDKSVTLEEMAEKAKEFDLMTYHRPNGTIDTLKQFISYDIPVITRTWLHVDEDIGHYRVVKGFDQERQIIIQDDSYEGANLTFSYEDFNSMWSKFDYEYLVLVPKEKQQIAEAIIGNNLDNTYAWNQAVTRNLEILQKNPSDIYSRFNLSVAYYYLQKYQQSVEEFEKVEHQLPFRTLWYQIEPILAYYELGNYDRVFLLTDKIFNNYNRAFSELYLIRGKIYQKKENQELARQEFEKAVFFNKNMQSAQESLNNLSIY